VLLVPVARLGRDGRIEARDLVAHRRLAEARPQARADLLALALALLRRPAADGALAVAGAPRALLGRDGALPLDARGEVGGRLAGELRDAHGARVVVLAGRVRVRAVDVRVVAWELLSSAAGGAGRGGRWGRLGGGVRGGADGEAEGGVWGGLHGGGELVELVPECSPFGRGILRGRYIRVVGGEIGIEVLRDRCIGVVGGKIRIEVLCTRVVGGKIGVEALRGRCARVEGGEIGIEVVGVVVLLEESEEGGVEEALGVFAVEGRAVAVVVGTTTRLLALPRPALRVERLAPLPGGHGSWDALLAGGCWCGVLGSGDASESSGSGWVS